MKAKQSVGTGTCVRRLRPAWPVALLAALSCGCGSAPKVSADDPSNAPRVAVVKAVRQDISSTLEIAAEFEPFQEIDVYAKVSGYIQKLYVDWGTHVSQGQLLAVLEIPELQQQLQLDQAAVQSQPAGSRARQRRTHPSAIHLQRYPSHLHAPCRRAKKSPRTRRAGGN